MTLRGDENFLVGVREKRAMDAGSADEKEFMLFNYRNMLTLWGPHGQINDYASRHYADLMDYYGQRWEFFFKFAKVNGCDAKIMADKFPAEILAEVEEKYMKAPPGSTTPTGKYWENAREVFHYYCPYIWPADKTTYCKQ